MPNIPARTAIPAAGRTNFLMTIPPYFSPLITGIRESRATMPTMPTTIPGIIMFHTMVMHMPTPRTMAPHTPSRVVPVSYTHLDVYKRQM